MLPGINWRCTDLADSDHLFEWRRRPHVAQFQYTDHAISRTEHDSWLPRALGDASRAYWTILIYDRPIGLANFADIDLKNRKCAWAFYIGEPEFVGRGVGSWIEVQILNEAFNVRQFNKLTCEVLTHNAAALAIHSKFGFKKEGTLRQHVFKQGVAHDVVLLALLRAEYLAGTERTA